MLVGCLRGEADIEVIGEASDAITANEAIVRCNPDLVTLDIEMPAMDGLSFLRHLMKFRPLPVIIISSHTPPGSTTSLEALRAGAVDVMSKPLSPQSAADLGRRLKRRIRELRACPVRVRPLAQRRTTLRLPARRPRMAGGLIAIGASAGGPQALELLLTQLPPDVPPIVIVQHMPAAFIPLFAERLDQICPMRVAVATPGEKLMPGVAYLAGGNHHFVVEQSGGSLLAGATRGSPVHHQRPAVDVLFHSIARLRGVPVVGVLLTGMGHDGADGMVALRGAGHETIAEDAKSCVVFGMPREAIARGGAGHILMLEQMPATILGHFDLPDETGRATP